MQHVSELELINQFCPADNATKHAIMSSNVGDNQMSVTVNRLFINVSLALLTATT